MKYRISRQANADLLAICELIGKTNSTAANRLDDEIHNTIQL
jgi:plasmid stabilization system protein ParE